MSATQVLDAADERGANEQLARVVKKYHTSAPALAAWMEENVRESLTVPDSADRDHTPAQTPADYTESRAKAC